MAAGPRRTRTSGRSSASGLCCSAGSRRWPTRDDVRLPLLLCLLGVGLGRTVDQLEQRHLRRVAGAVAEADDAGVAPGAAGVAIPELAEDLLEHRAATHGALRQADVGEATPLAEGDDPLGEPPGLLGLGHGGLDRLVLEQRRDHVVEHRQPVAGGLLQLPVSDAMAHRLSVLSRAVSGTRAERALPEEGPVNHDQSFGSLGTTAAPGFCGQLSSFIPRESPISARISLISFRDFRPKFLVFSISASVRWTRSPMVLMFACCRQLALRTLSSSSSTLRKRFSLSFASSFGASAMTGSSVSSKLMKTVSCSLMIFAA